MRKTRRDWVPLICLGVIAVGISVLSIALWTMH
jgi:hypothetical protein